MSALASLMIDGGAPLQVAAVSTPRAVLQAQAASYELVFAIQGPFLIAIAAAAVLLARPGMRALAIVYGCLSFATAFSAFSVLTLLGGGPPLLHDATLALTLVATAAMWVMNRRALAVLGGASFSARGVLLPVAIVSLLSIAIVLTAPRWPMGGPVGALFKNASPRPLFLALFLAAMLDAWRASRRASTGATAMRLVAASFAALAFRQAYGIVASLTDFTGLALSAQSVTVVQIASTALNGVALLAALMIEERDVMRAQAERVRAAELRVARTQRLESLGQMAGGIAHDFANVLTAISASVDSARQSEAMHEADEHLQLAADAVDRAAGLTRQLSLFARRRPPAISTFAVGAQLAAMRPLLDRLAGPGSTVQITVHAPEAQVRMDASQFEQLLLNLVVNARDAMGERGTIAVEAYAAEAEGLARLHVVDRGEVPLEGPLVAIEVRDTGTGIAADDFERIFEPYFSTKGDRGTGLGLATVRSVVRAAGGAIGVTSTVGVGTTFTVLLPRSELLVGA